MAGTGAGAAEHRTDGECNRCPPLVEVLSRTLFIVHVACSREAAGFTNNLRTCSVYYSGPKLLAGRGARRARPSSGRQEVSGRGVTTERVTVDRRLGR